MTRFYPQEGVAAPMARIASHPLRRRRLPVVLFHLAVLLVFALLAIRAVPPLPLFDAGAPIPPTAGAFDPVRFDAAQAHLALAEAALRDAIAANADDATGKTGAAAALRASGHAEASLARRPLNPAAWLVAGQSALLLSHIPEAVHALDRSLTNGPHEKSLAIARIDLALRLWLDLPTSLRSRIAEDIRWIVPYRMNDLVELALASPAHEAFLRIALAADPPALSRFVTALERRRSD